MYENMTEPTGNYHTSGDSFRERTHSKLTVQSLIKRDKGMETEQVSSNRNGYEVPITGYTTSDTPVALFVKSSGMWLISERLRKGSRS